MEVSDAGDALQRGADRGQGEADTLRGEVPTIAVFVLCVIRSLN
jgi:hypothetical protein